VEGVDDGWRQGVSTSDQHGKGHRDIIRFSTVEPVTICGVRIHFTAAELRVLELLATSENGYVTTENLMDYLCQSRDARAFSMLTSVLHNIRKKVRNVSLMIEFKSSEGAAGYQLRYADVPTS
jgi:DNA-binding response OmpR family regulator